MKKELIFLIVAMIFVLLSCKTSNYTKATYPSKFKSSLSTEQLSEYNKYKSRNERLKIEKNENQ